MNKTAQDASRAARTDRDAVDVAAALSRAEYRAGGLVGLRRYVELVAFELLQRGAHNPFALVAAIHRRRVEVVYPFAVGV